MKLNVETFFLGLFVLIVGWHLIANRNDPSANAALGFLPLLLLGLYFWIKFVITVIDILRKRNFDAFSKMGIVVKVLFALLFLKIVVEPLFTYFSKR